MNTQWSEFLQTRPVVEDLPAASCALNDLSHFGLIQVEGEDAEAFLQGQMTNDMRQVTETHSNLSGWCTAKGRMLASFRVFRLGDAYLLQTPAENLEGVVKRLGMYVLRAKVSVSDTSDRLCRIGLSGDCADELLQPHFASLPATANGVSRQDDTVVIRMPGPLPRYEIVGPFERLMALWQDLEGDAARLGEDFWALQEIRAGIPTVFAETREAFVPQMTNMQLTDGVSFTKGCYTGQEVVARMHYLGKLKRRMYLAHVQSAVRPRPGDELFAAGSTSGQGAGKIVDARPAGDGYELLAVIEVASAEAGEVLLGASGPKLEIRDLPYEFPSEKA
jgi:folate-binding protein YgfZ